MDEQVLEQEIYNEAKLISYLLGDLPEEEMCQIEEKYFADDRLHEELRATERDLIDRYAQDELSGREKELFENHFLSSPERRKRLRFAMALRQYTSTQSAETRESPPRSAHLPWWKPLFASPYLRAAAAAVILAGIGLGVWQMFFYRSAESRALIALKQAYRDQRPTETRLSEFDYAPFTGTRGEPAVTDRGQRSLAMTLLLDALKDDPRSETHHALGLLYLANREFDLAIDHFKEALKMEPGKARIHGDLGAALFEKAKTEAPDGSLSRDIRGSAESLEHLNKALSIDVSLVEALFNRALVYKAMGMTRLAQDDWQKYLEKDPTSKWADEARRNLKDIEDGKTTSESREDAFRDFLSAHEIRDGEQAWKTLSRSGTGNSIVERLIDEYLDLAARGSNAEAGQRLEALTYAGELKKEKAGDDFVSDLSAFYSRATARLRADIARARELKKSGYEHLLKIKYGDALKLFDQAGQIFIRAGDICEAEYVEYLTGHTYARQPNIKMALEALEPLARACESKKHTSLLARVLNTMADANYSLNKYSEAIRYSTRSFEIAEQAQDVDMQLKSAAQMAIIYKATGNHRQSLASLQRGLTLANLSPADSDSIRLFYDIAAGCFEATGLNATAIDYQREALRLASDSLTLSRCHANLSSIYGKLKNYEEAVKQAQASLEIGESQRDESARRDIVAFSSLRLGNLYREAGETDKAIASYDQNIALYGELNFSAETYAAHKGKFLCYVAAGDYPAAQSEMETALNILRTHRLKILEESNRNSYFDKEQDIYDAAIDFMYSKMNDPQKAFEYAEESKARSLLDSTGSSAEVFMQKYGPEIRLHPDAEPLTLAQIQSRLPERTQLLQYAALDDKLLVWVISKDAFFSAEVKIGRDQMGEKIRLYFQTVSRLSGNDEAEALSRARELYDLLIKPVESRLDKNKYIYIVPDDALNRIPFIALVSSASGNYLIKDYTFGVSPSATLFIKCTDDARDKEKESDERLLCVGNPRFDSAQFPKLEYLPSAAIEVKQVASFYKSPRSFIWDQAREKPVTDEMAKSGVIHFAAHYVANEDAPMLSKLLLAGEKKAQGVEYGSDGSLQAFEIYAMKLPRTRLVVLAGCQTGVEGVYRGEGAIGFARPFIAAKAPLVVASLWKVETEATAKLMINFHRLRKKENRSTVEALRRAQLEMLEGDERFRRPYYWAAFTVTGGYASF
jgi:CHAT domain-containing protein